MALPPGRAWIPTTPLSFPQTQVGFPRMAVNDDGQPIILMSALGPAETIRTWSVFSWRDSEWTRTITSNVPSFSLLERALSLTPKRHLVWLSDPDRGGYSRMVMAELTPEGFTSPDTALFTTSQDTEWGGAASASRRWVVRSHQFGSDGSTDFKISTAYSDTVGIWHALPDIGVDEDHCAIAPLADQSALVVYAGESGLGWAIVEGDTWTQQGNLDPRPLRAAHPRFRFRPSGGLWLLWTERPWVHVSWYHDGQWFRGDSLKCAHPAGQTFVSAWCDRTHDERERPVLVWGDLGYGSTFRDVGCIAFPTADGWTQGEEIPGSDLMFLTPYVMRDRNGDVWVGWRVRGTQTNRWTHTYVSAISTPPVVLGAGRDRIVTWNLSEPAPESWWAVLRARNEGPFEEVARVEAGATTEMSWTDSSAPAGVLRYRIRRESVDARYRWESEEARWPPRSQRPFTLSRSGAALAEGSLQLEGADAGQVVVRVYDIQGRLVLEQEARAGGSGRDSVRLDFGGRMESLPNGIYFAAARDASGRVTNPLKLVILR